MDFLLRWIWPGVRVRGSMITVEMYNCKHIPFSLFIGRWWISLSDIWHIFAVEVLSEYGK